MTPRPWRTNIFRDSQTADGAKVPFNYFPGDDPTRKPANVWRSHGHLLFGNWVNEMYQTTPYDPRPDRRGLTG